MNDSSLKFEKHLSIDKDDCFAVDWLASHCPLSKQKLKHAMQSGACWLTRGGKTNRLRRAKRTLHKGDELHLYYDEKILFENTTPATLVADEKLFSVWDKPCGMFSQGTKWGDLSAISRWVEQVGIPQRQSFQVHRLDRATSGLILVAHQKKVAAQLAAMFEAREITKHYRARVAGQFPDDEQHRRIDSAIDGKAAVTLILESNYFKGQNQSELLVKIETGRKHQIRKHLSSLGFPIIGDRLYGNKENIDDKDLPDLQLRSCYLAFKSPLDDNYFEYLID